MLLDKISAATLLLVEGDDEKDVSSLILSQIDIDWHKTIDIQVAGGKVALLQGARGIPIVSGFDELKKLAILVDADEHAASTDKQFAFAKSQFSSSYPNKQFDYFLLPGVKLSGALESVFLQSIESTNPNFVCVQAFAKCVQNHTPHTTQAQSDKLALMSYINSSVKNPYSRIGVALKHDARDLFDFKHPAFKPLVDFLESLIHV